VKNIWCVAKPAGWRRSPPGIEAAIAPYWTGPVNLNFDEQAFDLRRSLHKATRTFTIEKVCRRINHTIPDSNPVRQDKFFRQERCLVKTARARAIACS
jgi:hypothetical protein